MTRKILQYLLLTVLLLTAGGLDISARRFRQVPDTLPAFLTDSLKRSEADSLSRADSLGRADSTALARKDSLDMLSKSSLERPAFSTAKDSIITDFSDGKRMIYYYGGATVTYQNMQLTADYLEYNLKTNTVINWFHNYR